VDIGEDSLCSKTGFVFAKKLADRTVFKTRPPFFHRLNTVTFARHESQKNCLKSSNTHKGCKIEATNQK